VRTFDRFLALIACIASVTAHAVAQEKKPDPAAPGITYDEHIVPILREKCFGCHNPDKKSGGLILSNYSSLMSGGGSGEIVVPADAEGSRLFALVAHKEEPFMPPKADKLPDEQIELIREWIEGGLLENAGSKAKASNKPKFDMALKAAPTKRPDGPLPMPQNLLLEPVTRTARASAVTAVASSPWAPIVAVAGQRQVVLYNSDSLEFLGVLPFPEGTPQVVKFSRSGSLLLVAGGRAAQAGRVVVFDVTTGDRVIEVGDEFDAVLAADISADQTMIALGGPSRMIRIYSTADGSLLNEIKKHTDWVTALEFSPDGVLLATGDRNGGLFVWEANTAREYLTLRAHTACITDVSFRSDSNVLASCSEDTTIRLWEMENGGNIKGWGAHGGGASSARFTHDGRIASCGRDRVAKTWDQNGTLQRQFDPFNDLALRVTFNHDGSRLIAGDWTGDLRVWTAADGKLVGNLTPNPPTLAERIDVGSKELAVRKAAQQQLAIAAAQSNAAADKARADLAAAQKGASDVGTAAKTAQDIVTKAKETLVRANSDVTVAQAIAAGKQAAATAVAEVATQADDIAKKSPGHTGLADAAVRTKEHADKTAADSAVAQKALAELIGLVKIQNDQLATAQASLDKANADVAAAARQVEGLAAAAKAAADKAATDGSAVTHASAAIETLEASLARWTAAFDTLRQARAQASTTPAPTR
jgi:Planctomycete cytochrome C/WD domain, G-beta repeat